MALGVKQLPFPDRRKIDNDCESGPRLGVVKLVRGGSWNARLDSNLQTSNPFLMVKAVIHQSRVPDPLGVLAFFISTTIFEVR
jgi:hypothetical protein